MHNDPAMRRLRYAVRSLTRHPGFTLLAILALTVGIGANTAVFSVVHAVLLKSLPYMHPEELVFINEAQRGTTNGSNVPPANYIAYKAAQSYSAIGAAEAWGATLTGIDAPEQVRGLRLTASTFDVLGVKPAIGRVFTEGEQRVVVLSHAFWTTRFGGDESIVGRTIQLGGEPWHVAGVMPRDFRFVPFWVTNAKMFAPLNFTNAQLANRGARTLRVFARLKPGVTAEQSAHELNSLFSQWDPNSRLQPTVTPLAEMATGKVKTPLAVLLAAVGLVLLIACANVATLLLVRALGQRREFAIRLSLGATRWELLCSSLTESALLSIAGAVLGVLLASIGTDALANWFKASMPRSEEIGVSTAVLLFTAGIAVLTTFALGVISILQLPAIETNRAMKETAISPARRVLVVAQVALTLVLLVGAGLLTRTLIAVQAIDPGFEAAGVTTGLLHTWGTPVAPVATQMAFYRTIEERLRTTGAAGLVNHLPLAGDVWTLPLRIDGRTEPPPEERLGAAYRVATPGYFEAMGIKPASGRVLSEADMPGAPLVVVVNQTLAKQVWPNESAIGKRLSIGGSEFMTVCGVIKDVVQGDWMTRRAPEVYLPLAQHPEVIGKPHTSSMAVVSKAGVDIRRLVGSIEKSVPVSDMQTMDEVVANATRASRVYAALLAVFAGSALLLALIGLYGLVSSDVTRRTKEIGIRTAIGARPADIGAMIVRDAMSLAAIGAVIGLASSLIFTRALESMLYGVKPADAVTLLSVLLLFGCVAAVAAAVPARRAARLDPVHALRGE